MRAGMPLNNTPTSQIPLPLRRGSNKSEKGLESEAPETPEPPLSKRKERNSVSSSKRAHPERSSVKSSLLASSSFCCGSGQKEDGLSDGKVSYSRPLRKNKRDQDKSGSEVGIANGSSNMATRNRISKLENDASDEKPKNENRLATDAVKPRRIPLQDKKNPRVNNVLSSKKKVPPEVEIDASQGCNGTLLDPEMDCGRRQKYTDVIRKLHKDTPHYTHNNLMSLNADSNKLCPKDDNVKKLKSGNAEESNSASGCREVGVDAPESDGTDANVMIRSCDTEDLDCPCCNDDPESLGIDISIHKSDSLAEACSVDGGHYKVSDVTNSDATKENDLEMEVRLLNEKLESERLNLESQQRYILELENEVRLIQQLKDELAKEKDMREEAETKLRKMLDAEKREGSVSSESAVRSVAALAGESESSVIISYENRIRSYQSYITKLEENNAMLVSELKKLKDMSPTSQGEQAKMLLTKLTELESDNFQQKVEYEKCLDEVANKLVHTLLIQKKTEEECKMLHLRLEQLQLENAELMKFNNSKDYSQSHSVQADTSFELPVTSTPLNLTNDNSVSPGKGIDDDDEQLGEGPAVHYKPVRAVQSPIEKPCSVSHIPAYSSQRSSANRKKIKANMPNTGQDYKTHLSNHENTAPESNNNAKKRGTPSSDKVPSDTKTDNSPQRGFKPHAKPSTESSRLTSVKRKRATKFEPESKSKETKPRPACFQPRSSSKAKGSLCSDIVTDVLSKDLVTRPESCPQVQEVWNCSVDSSNRTVVPDFVKAPSDWSDNFSKNASYLDGKLQNALEMTEKKFLSPLRENECSVSTEGTSRARDEGYSTMSSDQQQDSVADTTVSGGEEPSSTYVPSVSNLARDDSVTDYLDGSMTSSSDSGFGPLQQIAISNRIHLKRDSKESNSSSSRDVSTSQNTDKSIYTVSTYLKDYTNKPSLTMISELPSQNDCCDLGDRPISDHTRIPPFEPSIQRISTIYSSSDNAQSQALPVTSSAQQSCSIFGIDHIYCNPNISCNANASGEERETVASCIQTCSKLSGVETAEKATLTEPEEATWREKALAHFIDESIWSLYSSESDTQFRLISGDAAKEFSPIDPVFAFSRNNPNCEVLIDGDAVLSVAENKGDSVPSQQEAGYPRLSVTAEEDLILLNNVHRYHPTVRCLERVASDSLLFQKDAVHELEDSMKPCLKASRNFAAKNIPLFHHFSMSDVCSNEASFESKANVYPEILLNLEKTMWLNNYLSPSSINPSRTSSVCSLPSSNSCHIISDETDDVDVLRHSSRKGSQDPDLSSASDAEYENLEHKDFVEKWIQKEIRERNAQIEVSTCPRNASSERRRPCFPFSKRVDPFRRRQLPDLGMISDRIAEEQRRRRNLKQSPVHVTPEDVVSSPSSSVVYPIIFTCENIEDNFEPSSNDIELDVIDSEVKEFNDDFYRLCDVGSSLSIDHSLPAILESLECSQKSHSKPSTTTKYKFSQHEELSVGDSQMPKALANKLLSKPTVFAKPVRPVTLSFSNVPSQSVIHRIKKVDLGSPVEESHQVISNPNSRWKSDRDQKMRKVSSPKRSAGKQRTRSQRNDSTRTSSINASNFECSYKLQPSLPANQNLGISCVESHDQHPDLTNCNRNVTGEENENVSPTNAAKEPGAFTKRYYARKDRVSSRNFKEGCGTAWIHLQADASLSDPKTRASLLDSMAAPVSSSGSSSEEEEECDVPVQSNTHLQKICREKRKRIKASRAADFMALCARQRSTVINRQSLYYRYGDREKEAIACFDFLEEIPTSSSELGLAEASKRLMPPNELNTCNKRVSGNKERINLMSPCASDTYSSFNVRASSFTSRLKAPILWNQPIRHNMSSSTLNSQDYEILDHVSLSDSCAESYTSTPDSFEDMCT